ncbi:MAG: Nramp family divalent metal transporter [Chloroflexi bacterium]|nr:Nramp family divalent metal transporter [Chloroflexota bacterium]MCL5275166.1 Nramp family divalent metal transporter [Chloroflexota bacterium]
MSIKEEPKEHAGANDGGQHHDSHAYSLAEVHRSIEVPHGKSFLRMFLAFAGPGLLIAVGYMDPGNWATDLAGGAQFGYTLLFAVMISNIMAIILQSLALKLGVVTGRDLAQACRDTYSKPVGAGLWVLAEIAIAATDLAEVVGSAVALQLLFGLPLIVGVLITALDIVIILFLNSRGFRYIEAIVGGLIGVITISFILELFFARPDWGGVALGFLPSPQIVTNPAMLYIAIGILGATVMPHNLYLHSSIIQTRKFDLTSAGKRDAIRFGTLDSTVSLMGALFINAAILILAAATFHTSGHQNVAEIQDAYKLLAPLLGTGLASVLFAIALLASGQNSTLTGTLAGQIVMEGFLNIHMKPWLRRLITRALAIIPAIIVIGIFGEASATSLLVLSQVVLSLQLSFAVIPLVMFTSNKRMMGEFANTPALKVAAWTVAILIAVLNIYLLVMTLLPS